LKNVEILQLTTYRRYNLVLWVREKLLMFLNKQHAMRPLVQQRIAPLMLNPGTKWTWLVNFTAQPLYSLLLVLVGCQSF